MVAILDAAECGDQRVLLLALRDHLASLIDDPTLHPRDLNSLCFRMLEIVRDVDALDRLRVQALPRRRRRGTLSEASGVSRWVR